MKPYYLSFFEEPYAQALSGHMKPPQSSVATGCFQWLLPARVWISPTQLEYVAEMCLDIQIILYVVYLVL